VGPRLSCAGSGKPEITVDKDCRQAASFLFMPSFGRRSEITVIGLWMVLEPLLFTPLWAWELFAVNPAATAILGTARLGWGDGSIAHRKTISPGHAANSVAALMKTEKEKMLAGELYDPLDPQLCRERDHCRDLLLQLNATREGQKDERQRLVVGLFGKETDTWIQPPFFCDYGTNIELGSKVFFNFNCVVLDVAPVTIGSNVLFGPAVQIYTATHPLDPAERCKWLEPAKPITIGSDVWIGGGAILCPGVTIGDRTVIGAGSVVTRSIPADVVAAGNPCRVLRFLNDIE
jgi:maltose O-acetyltransferase